jgi:hypothetical protein
VSDHSPDGGTRALPKKLTMTEIVDFEYTLTVCADYVLVKAQNRLQHFSRLKK